KIMLYLLILCLLANLLPVECKFKSLYCTIYDHDYGKFTMCKLKAINRYRNSVSVYFRQKQPAEKVMVRMEVLKRANGWRPFLYNVSVDLCDFLQRHSNMYLAIGFAYLKPYLKLNNSCPIKANDSVRCENFELDIDQFRVRFPFETGEYGLRLSFYYRKILRVAINGSLEYKNYKEH
ncbi:hypothetical protein KR200_002615, partial [Drosophila serrata]